MNFIQRYLVRRKERERFFKQMYETRASHAAVQHVFHEMVAGIGIEKLEEAISLAKKNDRKYVNLAELYIQELRRRRNEP